MIATERRSTERRSTGGDARRAGAAARLPIKEASQALREGDAERVHELARRVALQTGSRTAAIADLLHPAQVEVGNLWYLGLATSADELRAAAVVEEVVARLPATPVSNPVPRGFRCVLAAALGDPHRLGVTMLAAALEDEGWAVEVLEPDVRWPDVVRQATELRARLVCISAGVNCMSAGVTPGIPPLAQAIDSLHERRIRVLVAGVPFNRRPELWRQVGADAIALDVRIGTVLARRLGLK
jgi:methanogenic corrinoid protein MtbC1